MGFLILCLFIRFCSELIPKTDISVSSAMSVRGRGNLVWVPRHHFSRDSSLLHSALWIPSSPGSQPCKDSAVEGAKRIPQGLEGRAGSWDGAVPQLGIPVRSAISWKAELQLHTSQARLCSRGSSGAPGGLVLPPWPRTFSSHHWESPTKLPFAQQAGRCCSASCPRHSIAEHLCMAPFQSGYWMQISRYKKNSRGGQTSINITP